MYIKDFAEKYGFDRHTIDYWTNLGLLHPKVQDNGYRDYGDRTDEEIRIIIIALLLDRPGPLERTVDILEQLEPYQWRDILKEIETKQSITMNHFNIARIMSNMKIKEDDW